MRITLIWYLYHKILQNFLVQTLELEKTVCRYSTLIVNKIDQHPDYTSWNIECYMTCKKGFVHSYAYYEILSKRLCVHCGQEEHNWFWLSKDLKWCFYTLFQRHTCLFFANVSDSHIYNVLREFLYLSNPEEPKLATPESETLETEADPNLGLNKALDTYRKLIEKNVTNPTEPLTDKEQSNLENRIKEIESREVVEKVEEHEAIEIPCENEKITIGPPTLTRFEKARIMGARALQLSLGAPPFIEIPKDARISLDISMEELEKKVIPITIRRVLPNGDYQNIPIDYFK